MKRNPPLPTRHHAGPRPQLSRILDDPRHDPYSLREKPAEPAVCSECGAVYGRGRWRWDVAPAGAHKLHCPACRRAHDRLPAGSLTLDGPYVQDHRDELMALVAQVEAREKAEHPMHRVLSIEQHPDRIVVSTSDVHLPRRIGEALTRAHRGELELDFARDDYGIRAHWHA